MEDESGSGTPPPPVPTLTATRRPSPMPLPFREDCWSEGATATLIEAWGDRYLELSRGNLRQKHWQEVADAVNSRSNGVKPKRTDVQCKNRLDTLKKKFKIEKARVQSSNGAVSSKWPFYDRLDELIGSSKKSHSHRAPSPSPLPLPLSYRNPNPNPNPNPIYVRHLKEKRPAVDDSFFRRSSGHRVDANSGSSRSKMSPDSSESCRNNADDGFRELARAIVRFGEIYEKIEAAKLRQMMDLEKQRMEFSKGLEFQRMQIFMDAQVQLEKIKRAKRAGTTENYL